MTDYKNVSIMPNITDPELIHGEEYSNTGNNQNNRINNNFNNVNPSNNLNYSNSSSSAVVKKEDNQNSVAQDPVKNTYSFLPKTNLAIIIALAITSILLIVLIVYIVMLKNSPEKKENHTKLPPEAYRGKPPYPTQQQYMQYMQQQQQYMNNLNRQRNNNLNNVNENLNNSGNSNLNINNNSNLNNSNDKPKSPVNLDDIINQTETANFDTSDEETELETYEDNKKENEEENSLFKPQDNITVEEITVNDLFKSDEIDD